jgi:tartrate dehydrogenase/decarboxylase/D-malate dehydrogenase
MLEHLGETEAANSIMEAIDKSTSQGVLTVDLGGSASTSDVADAVIANL